MSDVTALATQAVAQSQTRIEVQVQVSLLKSQLDLQKQTAEMLIEMIGLGGNVDARA